MLNYPGQLTGVFHDAEDGYIGTLAGALEYIDAGTTTVVNFAHGTHTPEHGTLYPQNKSSHHTPKLFLPAPFSFYRKKKTN